MSVVVLKIYGFTDHCTKKPLVLIRQSVQPLEVKVVTLEGCHLLDVGAPAEDDNLCDSLTVP